MKHLALLLSLLLMALTGCVSDATRVDALAKRYPGSSVFTDRSHMSYIVVTDSCAIYRITFYPATTKIDLIDRIK